MCQGYVEKTDCRACGERVSKFEVIKRTCRDRCGRLAGKPESSYRKVDECDGKECKRIRRERRERREREKRQQRQRESREKDQERKHERTYGSKRRHSR